MEEVTYGKGQRRGEELSQSYCSPGCTLERLDSPLGVLSSVPSTRYHHTQSVPKPRLRPYDNRLEAGNGQCITLLIERTPQLCRVVRVFGPPQA
jgi:hypothetical protein